MPENGAHFSGEGHLIEAVILGDPNKTVIPVVCDSEGRLIIDLSSATITIGAVDIFDSAGNPLTSTSGSLNVNITNSSSPSPTGFSLFATNDSVPFGIETTILTYNVTSGLYINQIIAWGQYDGEFLVRQNGTIISGGRTSAADRTLNLIYSEPLHTISGDVITVTILEYGPALQQFRAQLLGQ
jgi:hypothetical protein